MTDEGAVSDELLTFDLNEWPADMLDALELMFRGRSIAFEWNPPGVLNVSSWHEHEVDDFLDYLEAAPVADPAWSRGSSGDGPMSVGDYYDGDARRSESEELDLGKGWTDTEGVRHTLCWVSDTGELTLMRAAGRPTIEVLTRSESQKKIEAMLGAWADVMYEPNSVGWLRERVAGVRAAAPKVEAPAAPTTGAPEPTDHFWVVPTSVGWITEEMDGVFAAYRELRARSDPDESLKHALVTALDQSSWERLTGFFAGEKDVVYGDGAGERARLAIRDVLENHISPH